MKNSIIHIMLLMLSLLFAQTINAKTDELPVRKIGYRTKGGNLKVSYGYKDIFTKKITKKLSSGLPTVILTKIIVEDKKRKQASIFALKTTIVYDLWENNYVITVQELNKTKRTRVNTIDEVITTTGAIKNQSIAKHLQVGQYRIFTIIEVNPVSKKMVRNIQKWISTSNKGFGGGGKSNYFGSFVGYFIDRNIGKAEKTLLFVSQWIYR